MNIPEILSEEVYEDIKTTILKLHDKYSFEQIRWATNKYVRDVGNKRRLEREIKEAQEKLDELKKSQRKKR